MILLDFVSSISGTGWSVQRAADLSDLLPNDMGSNGAALNDQEQALRDFLALYAVTQMDTIADSGSWEELKEPLVNDEALEYLFGDGTQSGGLIAHVLVGSPTRNSYDNIHSILSTLNIDAKRSGGHQNHFHLTIQTPQYKEITSSINLLSPSSTKVVASGVNNRQEQVHMLLGMWEPTLNLKQSAGLKMFIPDTPPEIPQQDTPIMLVESYPINDPNRTIGMCRIVENQAGSYTGSFNTIKPIWAVGTYFSWFEHKQLTEEGKVTLLQSPNQGKLKPDGNQSWVYSPNDDDYLGTDSAIFLVEVGGFRVKLTYGFKVLDSVGSGDQSASMHQDPKFCPRGEFWRVSPNGEVTPLYNEEVEYSDGVSLIEGILRDTLSIEKYSLSFSSLKDGALGESIGRNITLGPNANGYGWYIDMTPGLNEEFLPTANPYEWKAKPGSEAEGKVDMLTVLLHEAAHTLGFDHTNDSHALMAPTLEPGIRRLPSAELLAELQGLADQEVAVSMNNPDDPSPMPNPIPFAGFGAFWIGRLRKSGYGYLLESVGVNNDRDIQKSSRRVQGVRLVELAPKTEEFKGSDSLN